MKKILRIVRLVALHATILSGMVRAEAVTPPAVQLSIEEKEFIHGIFNAGMLCIRHIDKIVEQISLLIGNNHVHGLSNKEEIKQILILDRQLLKGLLQSLGSLNDPIAQIQVTGSLLHLCDEFITHLESGLKSNLKKIKPFDPTTLANKRSRFNQLDPNKIPEELYAMENRINKLQIKAEQAGLTWYNIWARSVDKNIVTRWNKYNLTPIVQSVGLASILGAYMVVKFGTHSNTPFIKAAHSFLTTGEKYIPEGTMSDNCTIASTENPIDSSTLNNRYISWWPGFGKFGDSNMAGELIIDGNKQALAGTEALRLIPSLEYGLNQLFKNNAPIAMAGAALLWQQYTTTWKMNISPWMTQKKSLYWNKLRGGVYLNAETPGLLALDPKVSFDDMTGLEEIKDAFSTILNYIDNPEQFTLSNAKPEMGWILTGPPRTGKSFSFECLCGEIVKMQKRKGLDKFNFFKIGIDEIAELGIKTLLRIAKDHAPMILFVDEIDLLGLQRVGDNKLLHEFLTAFQTTQTDDPSKIVIVMAATNSPETLDKALRQYGRFGKELRFELPGFKYRKQYLIKELSKMALDVRDFDIDSLVAKTENRSYEDIQAILRSAMTTSWALNMPLTQEMLEMGINKEMHKIIMIDRKELSEHELRILAAHFSGEALAMMLLETHAQLDTITTKAIMAELQETTAWYAVHLPSKDEQKKIIHGGIFTKHCGDTINLKTKDEIINEAKVLVAGFAAEEVLLGTCGMLCHKEEYYKAYSMIEELTFEGIDPTQLSKQVREELRTKAYKFLNQCKEEVKKLLIQHKDTLVALTDELIKTSIMTDKQVQAIIDTVEKKANNAAPVVAA